MAEVGRGNLHPDEAMSGLRAAASAFRERDQAALTEPARGQELRDLRAVIDSLEQEFAISARTFQRRGGHAADGACTAVGWISRACDMSSTSAADRLCVGKQLESLPEVARALSAGEIGYQSTSVLCHLREQLGEKRELFVEDEMLELARSHSVHNLRLLCRYARHAADPDGFFKESEEDFSRRWLHISPMADGMHSVDGVLDQVGGAAVRSALDSLSRHVCPDDNRSYAQRMADALVELTHHALDRGTLPARSGVKPHLSVTTTLEGLKGELGAPAADVEFSLPVSTRTVERIACDSSVSRVLLSDSAVIDVGRATRVISGPTRRALRARDRGCRWPCCDRPVGWTSAHHIVAWTRGGETRLKNLVSVCHTHHRLVHEGGWQVVSSGSQIRFLPPERTVPKRVRGPGVRWAA